MRKTSHFRKPFHQCSSSHAIWCSYPTPFYSSDSLCFFILFVAWRLFCDSSPIMEVYHSSFVNEEGITKACGCPLLPLKSHIKGPAPVSDQDTLDIVDEAITFFRANVFFRNFDVKSSADKLLIYLTFYINIALKRLEGCRTLAEGTKAIISLGLEKVPLPGEPGFPFGGLFPTPESRKEAELFRNYLKQIREETSGRLLSCAYRHNGTPNKWWLAFSKRKFMNIVVPNDFPESTNRINTSLRRLSLG